MITLAESPEGRGLARVVELAKGYGHCLRTTPCSSTRQTPAE
tara:strand:- start:69 stop:194 length:126 start_codon:yes stop_codon:yes gene_type:complete